MIQQPARPQPVFTPEQARQYEETAARMTKAVDRKIALAHKYEELVTMGRETLERYTHERRKIFSLTLANALVKHDPLGHQNRLVDDLGLHLQRIESSIWMCLHESAACMAEFNESNRLRQALWDAGIAQSIMLEAADPAEIDVLNVRALRKPTGELQVVSTDRPAPTTLRLITPQDGPGNR